MEIGADSRLRVGRDLREERERRKITLEQVAKATRFSMRHLQSLEADLFDELPGGVLRKGLIRSYCQFLDLDEETWMERFAANGALDGAEVDLAQFAENVHRARLEAMPPVRRRWWGVVAMVMGLVVLAAAVWHFVIAPRLGSRRLRWSPGVASSVDDVGLREVGRASAGLESSLSRNQMETVTARRCS